LSLELRMQDRLGQEDRDMPALLSQQLSSLSK
jgi:hypothetical protein